MARRERTFLVDSYVPGVDALTAQVLAARLGGTDHRLRWLCALAIPAEETVTCVVSASEPQEVIDLFRAVGLSVDHVTEVVVLTP